MSKKKKSSSTAIPVNNSTRKALFVIESDNKQNRYQAESGTIYLSFPKLYILMRCLEKEKFFRMEE